MPLRQDTLPALSRLRRQWTFLWPAGAGVVAIGGWALGKVWGLEEALQWGMQAAVVWAYVLIRLGSALAWNHPPRDPRRLEPRLGTANGITVARSILIAALAGFLFQPWHDRGRPDWLAWAPGILYLLASALDYADGYLARRTDTETRLGEFLDMEIDALGLMVASCFLVWSGRAPIAYLFVGMGYYASKAAIRIRRGKGRIVHDVKPRPGARLVAGLEMGFAAAALLPAVGSQATRLAAWVMTTVLAQGFVRDWLIVCGWASADGRPIKPWLAAFERIGAGALPFVLRGAVLAVAARLLTTEWVHSGLFELTPSHPAMLVAGAVACGLGVAARAGAMVLSIISASLLTAESGGTDAAVLLTCALILMITGAGPWRLCQPEDRFLLEKHGTPAERS